LIIHGQVMDASVYFKMADLVITQSGHSTAMELLTLGKPSIMVPDANQTEQENNARRMVELGVSRQITYDTLSGGTLKTVITDMLATDTHQQAAEQMAQRADDIHGAAAAANVLREYAHRLLAY
nr:hypothetical protein [Vampirovibrio sp.]